MKCNFEISPRSLRVFLCALRGFGCLRILVPGIIILCKMGVFFTTLTNAQQNLINNSSFESETNPPSKGYGNYLPGEIMVNGWFNPTAGTPDYYNSHNSKVTGGALAQALSFEGRIGLVLSAGKKKPGNYKEYTETRLSQPMEADKRYCVSFFIAHERTSGYTAPDLGVYFSPNMVLVNYRNELPVKPSWTFSSDTFLISQTYWTEICFPYYANGGEEYMVIGSFSKSSGRSLKSLNRKPEKRSLWGMRKKMAYYYLDEVYVRLSEDKTCDCEKKSIPKKNLIFLVDVSNSMNNGHKLDSVKSVITQIIPSLPVDVKINLFSFSSGAHPLFTGKIKEEVKDSLNYFLNKMHASGNTNPQNAFENIITFIQQNQLKNNHVIFISDGEFKEADIDVNRISEQFVLSNTSFSCFSLRSAENWTKSDVLSRISEKTDGVFFIGDPGIYNYSGMKINLKNSIGFSPAKVNYLKP